MSFLKSLDSSDNLGRYSLIRGIETVVDLSSLNIFVLNKVLVTISNPVFFIDRATEWNDYLLILFTVSNPSLSSLIIILH